MRKKGERLFFGDGGRVEALRKGEGRVSSEMEKYRDLEGQKSEKMNNAGTMVEGGSDFCARLFKR